MNASERRTRRLLLKAAPAGLLYAMGMGNARALTSSPEEVDHYLERLCREQHVPGLSVCIVGPRGIAWSKGYGFADLGSRTRMSPSHTVQNVGSVSKTVTATAVMQLCERGVLSLTQDVNEILPFSLRNPFHPTAPITIQQLLVHRSSIQDGPAYSRSYACGPSKLILGDWLRSYLSPTGRLFDAKTNFHPWQPGQSVVPSEPRSYSNIGFGVLGYLVELASKTEFSNYCRREIFVPAGMRDTTWRLLDVPPGRHAVAYQFVDASFALPEGWSPADMLPANEAVVRNWPPAQGSQYPHCAYEFATYPDGGLRTTAEDLGKFLQTFVNRGASTHGRILSEGTVARILSDQQLPGETFQGLGWVSRAMKSGQILWGHGGSDPGVVTAMYFDPIQRIGFVVLSNGSQDAVKGVVDYLYQYHLDRQWPPLKG
jgi:CubicO group peptidase (beta-lactamase class C family)